VACKTLKKIDFSGVFFEKRPLLESFQNYVPKGFIASPIDVLCSNFVKFSRREIGEIVRCLPDKQKKNKISPRPVDLATARIALKGSRHDRYRQTDRSTDHATPSVA